MWKSVAIKTGSRVDLISLTAAVEAEVQKSGIKTGICYLFVPHTTAGITLNENADPDVVRDLIKGFERIVPVNGDYRHSEGNSDAHLKAALMGFSVSIPIVDGKPALGVWQGIYFCEFDGPRFRKVMIGIIEERE